MRVHAAIEGLRGERMGDGDQGHVRLLAKGEPQAKGAMRGQVADENVRQRLAVIPASSSSRQARITILVLAILDNLAIAVDAHAIDDGFAIAGVLRFGLLVLGPDETALDAGLRHGTARQTRRRARSRRDRRHGAWRRCARSRLQAPRNAIHIVGKLVRALILRRQAVIFLLCGGIGGGVFLGKLHRMRIGAAQPVGMGIIDVNRNPLPAFRLLHLRGDAFQLFDDKPVEQRGVLEKPPRSSVNRSRMMLPPASA
jgi:hypothetical protein